MQHTHDVIVIGAGAAGLTAAGGCAMFGLKPALIEAGEMGGECLNTGCVPSKALIASANRAAQARMGPRLGVAVQPPVIDWSAVHDHIHAAIADIAPHDSQERFETMGCEVIRGRAFVTGPHSVTVEDRRLRAPRIVVATGSSPAVPPVPGLEDTDFLTNETVFDLALLPDRLIVLGGGAMGVEMAQAFCRLGSDVTVIEPGDILAREDRDHARIVIEAMQGDGVRFVRGRAARVTQAGSTGPIRVTLDSGEELHGSHLLLATGRRANARGFGLEEIGVEIGPDGIVVDRRRRSSVRSIHAIGDCRAGPRLTHVAGYEGGNVALEIATGLPARVDWKALPRCTYTEPEIAQIGLTLDQARERFGNAVTVETQRFADNDRAIAEGAATGQLKLILKGRKVVGASIVGAHAGEMLLPISQMITGKASTFALGSAVVSYPTRSEIVKAAAFAAWEPIVFGNLARRYARLVARIRRLVA